MIVSIVLMMLSFAFFNRARGSELYELSASTVVTRLASTLAMATVTSMLRIGDLDAMLKLGAWTWASLMVWCTFGWDNYWSAAIGNPTNVLKPVFAPVDYIMLLIFPFPTAGMETRIWGMIAMGLRQSLAILCIVGVALISGHPEHSCLAILTPLFGTFYFAWGFVSEKWAIPLSELSVGAGLGLLITLAIS